MNRLDLIAHVRRYPRWYTFVGAWVAAMLFLTPVGAEIVPSFLPTPMPSAAPATAPAPAEETASAPTVDRVAATPSMRPSTGIPAGPAAGDDDVEVAAPTTTLETIPPESVEPNAFDPVFDAVPTPPAVDTPPELMPVLRVVSPIANYGCSATGLVALVIAVVAPTVEQVPLERLIPYLGPVTTACANFPIPETHTVCPHDEPFIIDVGGLTKSPPIIGVGIDLIEAFEVEMNETYGVPMPPVAQSLREQLGCRIES